MHTPTEHDRIRIRSDSEPQHDGRSAVVEDDSEARPHPAADWADFMRTVCAGCPLC